MININNKSWTKLRFSDIQKHLSGSDDETFFFEYKSDKVSSEKFINEVSAFANTFGGYIFLGVGDDKTIEGCSTWTEQKIHSVMHDCITPIPNFDVKKFKSDNKIIYVVKIEEGMMPPYITNKGTIYERVSSGSFVIKDSNKLTQIFYKRESYLRNLEKKLYITELAKEKIPINLCAYIDVGMSFSFNREERLQNKFYKFDLSKVTEYLKTLGCGFTLSKMGKSFIISIGGFSFFDNQDNKFLPTAGISNFTEIMEDGSIKYRILIYSRKTDKDGQVEISDLVLVNDVFKKIYSLFFANELKTGFISAQKYEKLTVIKQFIPYFEENEDMHSWLLMHQKLYGNNLIIDSNRFPKTGFFTIEKRDFSENKVKFNYENLLNQLFICDYIIPGYILDS